MFVLQIFLLQLLMSLVLAAMGQFLHSFGEQDDGIVVDYLPKGIFGFNKSVLNFFTYFLLMSTLIPISLFVSIECKRFLISRWFEVDSEMYSLIQDRPAKVSNSAVINDLGQISYLFSDKTGTLTCNEMKFKSMTIGDLSFGDLHAEAMPKFQSSEFDEYVVGKKLKDVNRLMLSQNFMVTMMIED